MGGAVSGGETNDELIDNLADANYIRSHHLERIFRSVDRADYYLKAHRDSAYKDLAWKHGNLHLSAPCIYAEVLEHLELGPGMSFLNLGSGTGYLSTLAGLLLGAYGVNHGIELHGDVVSYARLRLDAFIQHNQDFDAFEFCEPRFVTGNALLAAAGGTGGIGARRYDRVYCGAACPPQHQNYIMSLVSIGGKLVMPFDDQLVQIHRVGEDEWKTKCVLPVSFAVLVSPTKNHRSDIVELPDVSMLSLQEICRVCIRRILRQLIEAENPNLVRVVPRPVRRRSPRPRLLDPRPRRVNIVPMNVGMMILGRYTSDSMDNDDGDEDEDDDDNSDGDGNSDDEEEEGREQEAGREEGALCARYRSTTGAEEAENGREPVTVIGGEEDEGERSEEQQSSSRLPAFEITRYTFTHPPQVRKYQVSEEEEEEMAEDNKGSSDDEEEDHGFEDAKGDIDDVKAGTGDAEKSAEGSAGAVGDVTSGGTEEEESSAAIPIRQRYSSCASVSAGSYTSSGLGTCSSVEEACEFQREILSEAAAVIEEAPEPAKLTGHSRSSGGGDSTEDEAPNRSSSQNPPPFSAPSPATRSESGHGGVQLEHIEGPPPMFRHYHGSESDESMDYEVDSDDDDDSEADLMEAIGSSSQLDEDERKSVISSGYGLHMHEKITALPVPLPIKQFLMFYRT